MVVTMTFWTFFSSKNSYCDITNITPKCYDMGLTHYTAHTVFVFVFVCISIYICQTTFVSLKKVDYSGEI